MMLVAVPATAVADDDSAGLVQPPSDAAEMDVEASKPVAGQDTGSVNVDVADHRIDVAAGLRLGASGAAGFGFEDDEYVEDQNGQRVPAPTDGTWAYPEYYPHGGAGVTGGLTLEGRYNDIVGLETGFFYSRDNAAGWVDKRHANTDQRLATIHSEQRTSALHIPLLLKASVPTEHVRPFIAGGFNFVFQNSSELEYRQERAGNNRYATEQDMQRLNDRNQIEPSNYAQVHGSAGVELLIEDIRIPVELRLGYTLGYDQAMDQRARGQDGQIIYDGVYLGHFGIFVGALYEFDVLE